LTVKPPSTSTDSRMIYAVVVRITSALGVRTERERANAIAPLRPEAAVSGVLCDKKKLEKKKKITRND
jgi:hypothetical protein